MKKILLTTIFLMGCSLLFSQNVKLESMPGTQIVDYAPTPEQAQQRVFPMGYAKMIEAQLEATRKLNRASRKAAPNAAKFQVFYEENSGITPEVKAVFEKAAEVWASALSSDVPVKILVRWRSLARGVLGSAGPATLYRNFAGATKARTWYPIALAEKMAHKDLNGDNQADIVAQFNSDRTDWYLGTDANPTRNQYDLYSVVLHEYGHGLGFTGTIGVDDALTIAGWGNRGSAGIFDNFIVNNSGISIVDSTIIKNNSAALLTEVTSRQLFLSSPIAIKNNGGQQPKLYTPSKYAAGSSIYHVDQATYPIGSKDALMSPQIAAGEITRNIGGIVLGTFADMGWVGSSILHDQLKDNEDTSKDYILSAKVLGDTTIKDGSIKLFVSTTTNKISDAKEVITTKKGNEYSYTIPKSNERKQISYYWTGEDLAGRKLLTPAEAPKSVKGFESFYQFTIGADTVKPVLSYNNLIFTIYDNDTDIKLSQGQAFDNLGIDSVYVEYSINGIPQKNIPLTTAVVSAADDRSITFDGAFKFIAGQIKGNDVIKYRIVVKDKAKIKNIRYAPESGFYEVKVLKLFSAVKIYTNNFDDSVEAPEDFYLKGFSVMQPAGFSNKSLNSTHPYKNGSEEVFPVDGNLFTNYISQLLRPITLRSDTAKIYFDEIVLVEPGDAGSVYPDRNFFDYVVVEGSKDAGKTWQAFQAGWDSRDDVEWKKAWDAKNLDKDQNSKFVGNPSLFRPRTINMLESGDFKGGDNVLVRFRMLADPLAFGWGWAIDNLNIQSGNPYAIKKVIPLASEPVIEQTELKLMPNPSNTGQFLMTAKFAKPVGNLTLSVMTLSGKEVSSMDYQGIGKELNQVIDLSRFVGGIYLIRMQAGEEVIVRKAIYVK